MKAAPNFCCRSCLGTDGCIVLDLGLQPLANNLVAPPPTIAVERRCPLVLGLCRRCMLLQLLHLVGPEELFSDYVYFSSFSTDMLRHAKAFVAERIATMPLNRDSFVVEVASNDGYLLQHFVQSDIPCLGVEPAKNVAATARRKGVATIEKFFGHATALEIASRRKADLIVANNVFAHAPDPNDFVRGIAALLAPGGIATVEFPWAAEMLRGLEFDTIYHEHVFYFAITPLQPLLERHRLEIVRVESLAIHGGSLRVHIAHRDAHVPDSSVQQILQSEHLLGLDQESSYAGFAAGVESLQTELCQLLKQLKQKGARIAAYGASAKGSTLLNCCNIGTTTIDFIADRSPHKQGYLSPGQHIPILPPESLEKLRPDYALLLTWNFADEILEQQRAYRDAGGRFIVPIPSPRIIE